jgi:hypothetical protein
MFDFSGDEFLFLALAALVAGAGFIRFYFGLLSIPLLGR